MLGKKLLENCVDGPMSNTCKVLEKIATITSRNRTFRITQYAVAINERTKKDLSHFSPKRNDQPEGTHTHPPHHL